MKGHDFEAEAHEHRAHRRWAEARLCYMKLIEQGCSPIDRAKMQANIMQMFELEGSIEDAKRWGNLALESVREAGYYEPEEGEGVRGYVAGTLQRLADGRPLKNPGRETYSNTNHFKLPLRTFYYFSTFCGGLYWGISFRSGAWGQSVAFPLLAPPVLCLGGAVAAAMIGDGDKRHIILGAVTLYVTFLFAFGIGYGLAEAGIIRFGYHSRPQ